MPYLYFKATAKQYSFDLQVRGITGIFIFMFSFRS